MKADAIVHTTISVVEICVEKVSRLFYVVVGLCFLVSWCAKRYSSVADWSLCVKPFIIFVM